MSKIFDVAACQFELEDGIEKDQAIYLIGQLPEGRIIPFFTSANNTSAAGFISYDVFEKFGIEDIDERIIKFIESIIDDNRNETVDGIYDFNGVSISLQYKPISLNFTPIEDKVVVYEGARYSVYEEGNGPDLNAIAINGKTLELKRSEQYEASETGYVVEATRLEGNRFKCEDIWLCVDDRGWTEAELIKDDREALFVQSILKECGIELQR